MAKRQYTGDPIDMTQQHISERDLDEEAEDVEYATESEPAGQESVDFWPSSATPREDLNETQIAVIEAYADPTREFETQRELSRKVVPGKSEGYANTVLRDHLGKEPTGFNGTPTQPNIDAGIDDPAIVDKLREELVSGTAAIELARRFDVSDDVVRNAAKAKYEVYDSMDTKHPPVEYTDKEWQFKDVKGEQAEETEADQMVGEESEKNVNRLGQPVEKYEKVSDPNPDPDEPVASGDAPSGDGSNCVAAAAAAIVVWELARRVVGRLR